VDITLPAYSDRTKAMMSTDRNGQPIVDRLCVYRHQYCPHIICPHGRQAKNRHDEGMAGYAFQHQLVPVYQRFCYLPRDHPDVFFHGQQNV
jgi:hypothetical protein